MANSANYSASTSTASTTNNLSISNPIFTNGVNPPDSSKIDWESILPNLKPYAIRPKQNNPDYDTIPQQTRQNIINIQDIIQNNQNASNLTLPTPISQGTIPRYQANSPQNSYKMVA